MSEAAFMSGNQAEPTANRKPAGRDLFMLIGRAIDQAAEAADLRGRAFNVWIDPLLRSPREVDARHLDDTVKRLAAVALSGARDHVIWIRAEPEDDVVRVSATAGPDRTWTVTVAAPRARPRVLVIDDDPAARVELASALSASGLACSTAPSSEAALHALFAGGPWAAVLIELYLETGDALELAGLSEAPVFAMSARDRTVSGWALRQAGFHGLFSKPVPIAKLKAAIGAWRPEARP